MDLHEIAATRGLLRKDLESKANTDGSYDLMTVGEAKALVGRGDGTAQQFVFRPTGGTESVGSGKARIKLKGNTVVFNQLVEDGQFTDISKWSISSGWNMELSPDNSIKLTQTGTSNLSLRPTNQIVPIVGHKYYLCMTIKASVASTNQGGFILNGNSEFVKSLSLSTNYEHKSVCGVFSGTPDVVKIWFSSDAFTTGSTVNIKDCMCVDLTQMFGSGNEPSTAAEFEALYPNAYYDYNTGELVNFNANGIKTVGFNAYNPTSHTAALLGGQQYQITGTYTSVSYSTGETLTIDSDGKFTPASNGTLTVTGYGDDTCVHLVHSGYMDGEFEEHWDETKTLPVATYFPTGMKSAGTTYDELQGGKAIQRVGTRAYQSGDENDSTLTTDKTNTNYPLATAVETAITTPVDLTYRVDDFGTEQIVATGDCAPLKADIAYALNAVDFIRNAPQNYISKESMDEFCSALGTSLGKTITATWNASTKRYTYTITTTE